MTDSPKLERRYRRLLAFYPKAFRREHEQEMLSVLMGGAAEGQWRPRLTESVDLLRNGAFTQLRYTRLRYRRLLSTRLPSRWEYRHARVMIPVRIGTGVWLVILTGILYGYGRGGWWGALLVPAAALHFFLAYRLVNRSGDNRTQA
jgi:hypothetical protein